MEILNPLAAFVKRLKEEDPEGHARLRALFLPDYTD